MALSCILGGSFLAYQDNLFRIDVLILAALTTILLQVLSNIANDYGDGVKGTDNDNRVGPERAIQSKAISPDQMKRAVIINAIIAFVVGLTLIYTSLKEASVSEILIFTGLGVASVVAAIMYTVGKKAYGYSGMGDIFVFLFFGLIGVFGVYYLHTHIFKWEVIWMATFVGLMSTAVLNMNNMRDISNDKESGKNTLVVKIGFASARYYHSFLIIGAIVSLQLMIWSFELPSIFYLAFLPSFLFLKNALFVHQVQYPKLLDPELKKLALGTFGTVILLWISTAIV